MASNKSKTPGPIQVVVVLMLTVLAFYFGNRFGQVFDFNTMEITDGALATVNSIVAAPAAISMASVPMLYAIGLAITVLIVWLYTFMYAGNYRYGEEAGSAKWGTLKEGVAFKDQTDPSNNLLFTKNYGLALKKPKFDLEHDRNLNVMVIGGSGSGKTRNYVKPNLMQSMFAYPTVLNYFSRFSNEGRKFGLLLTGISQNAVAMLKNKAAQNLVLNSDFLLLLKQSPLDRAEWVRLLGLSEQEEEFIDESVEPGDGLLIAGGARVPIRGKFPSGNVLYDLFSTNPNEAADKKRMQEFAAREKSRLG